MDLQISSEVNGKNKNRPPIYLLLVDKIQRIGTSEILPKQKLVVSKIIPIIYNQFLSINFHHFRHFCPCILVKVSSHNISTPGPWRIRTKSTRSTPPLPLDLPQVVPPPSVTGGFWVHSAFLKQKLVNQGIKISAG